VAGGISQLGFRGLRLHVQANAPFGVEALTHSLSLSLTHTLFISLSHTHKLTHSLALTHTHTHTHSRSHTHTLARCGIALLWSFGSVGITDYDATSGNLISHKILKVVLQKLIPTRIRQLILCISSNKEYVDGFVRELDFSEQLYKKHFV